MEQNVTTGIEIGKAKRVVIKANRIEGCDRGVVIDEVGKLVAVDNLIATKGRAPNRFDPISAAIKKIPHIASMLAKLGSE